MKSNVEARRLYGVGKNVTLKAIARKVGKTIRSRDWMTGRNEYKVRPMPRKEAILRIVRMNPSRHALKLNATDEESRLFFNCRVGGVFIDHCHSCLARYQLLPLPGRAPGIHELLFL